MVFGFYQSDLRPPNFESPNFVSLGASRNRLPDIATKHQACGHMMTKPFLAWKSK